MNTVIELPSRQSDKALPVSRLRTTHMSLYPTMGSMAEAVEYIEAQLPVTSAHQLFPLLMTYHNTLLAELEKGA